MLLKSTASLLVACRKTDRFDTAPDPGERLSTIHSRRLWIGVNLAS